MANVYLIAAHYCLRWGQKQQAIEYLCLALGECNKDGLAKAQVLVALNYARRV